MTTRRMRRLTVLCLLGLAPAFGHADEGAQVPQRYRPLQGGGSARRLEALEQVVTTETPGTTPLAMLRDRLLAAGAIEGRNDLERYMSADIHPTRIEVVGRHLIYREAGRHWRRLVNDILNEQYATDPSYGPHELALDKRRMAKAWQRRNIRGLEGLHVARVAPAAGVARRNCGLFRSRFVGVDRDLRLRMNFRELVGVAIGDGPEDDFDFAQPTGERLSRRDGLRLPRVQIRGRGRLRIDTQALTSGAPLDRPLNSYGGIVSIDFMSPSRTAKILTAFFELAFKGEGESELIFGLKRRF